MNAEYPTLAEHLAQHHWRGSTLGCECRWNWPKERNYFCGEDERIAEMHRKHQAATWREACTIRTAEQLDALPEHAIVRAGTNGHAYEKSMLFTLIGRRWMEAGNGSPERSDDIGLPALLIWHPGWVS